MAETSIHRILNTHLPLKNAMYMMGVNAFTNFRMKVLKINLSSKLLSVLGTSEKTNRRQMIKVTLLFYVSHKKSNVIKPSEMNGIT